MVQRGPTGEDRRRGIGRTLVETELRACVNKPSSKIAAMQRISKIEGCPQPRIRLPQPEHQARNGGRPEDREAWLGLVPVGAARAGSNQVPPPTPSVIASPRVRAARRPRTGSAKQSRGAGRSIG